MDWKSFLALVHNRVSHDGKAYVSLDNTQFGSPLSIEAVSLLNAFVEETYAIYTDRADLTVAQGDRIIDLLDDQVCDPVIWLPRKVWIDGKEVEKCSYEHVELMYTPTVSAQGWPRYWARHNEGEITFSREIDQAYSECYVSGWTRHPAITGDSTIVKLPDRICRVAAMYCAAELMLPVAADNVTTSRLQLYDQRAHEEMMKFAAQNKARIYA